MDGEMSRRLRAFERDHGPGLIALASHAALPVVLDPHVLHLIRINYFIDPPHTLPYGAEATLLLSPLCTEIDDGLYAMDPQLRDLLLKRLVADFGGPRVREVARLLWEYCGRGAPWSDRPGLMEAQQLTAMNFIDAPRALAWLQRASRGEGGAPVDDRRWFVALEQDMKARTAALREAEGEASSPAAQLPALAVLHDALIHLSSGAQEASQIVKDLKIQLPEGWDRQSPSRQWRAILDAAWQDGLMAQLLAAVEKWASESQPWQAACQAYWSHITPALRVEQGQIAAVPPEWQVLQHQRAAVERAIGATLAIYLQQPRGMPMFRGMGALVGDYAILTHASIVSEALDKTGGLKPGHRILADRFADLPAVQMIELQPSGSVRLDLVDARRAAHDCAVLRLSSAADRTALPAPLRLATDTSLIAAGRKIFVLGYPMEDSRNDPELATLIFGESLGAARLQPGEILEENESEALISHNCFTAGGNGGSPLVDIETGQVLGVHLGSRRAESMAHGVKIGQAISIARLAGDEVLLWSGAFDAPTLDSIEASKPWRAADEIFVNRERELSLFADLLHRGHGQVLRIEGPAGIGKTALMYQMASQAEQRGFRVMLIDRMRYREQGLLRTLRDQLQEGATTPVGGTLEQRLLQGLTRRSTAVLIDDLEHLNLSESSALSMLEQLVLESQAPLVLVLAGRALAREDGPFKNVHSVRLGPLDEVSVEQWLSAAEVDTLWRSVHIAQGVPAQVKAMIEHARALGARPPTEDDSGVSLESLLPTVEVTHPSGERILMVDDASEMHGPFVRTRGEHVLSVPARYRIGLFPVTNAAFYRFVRDGGYMREDLWPAIASSVRSNFRCRDGTAGPASWDSSHNFTEEDDLPVSGISFLEAQALIAWLNHESRAPGGGRWRLPTEDMWELAARGPHALLYPWGSDFNPDCCNSKELGLGRPSPAGMFPKGRSVFGAEDMSGNVWEFVDSDHPDALGCVLRGGGYNNTRDEVKASLRLFDVPLDHRPLDFGMRCAFIARA